MRNFAREVKKDNKIFVYINMKKKKNGEDKNIHKRQCVERNQKWREKKARVLPRFQDTFSKSFGKCSFINLTNHSEPCNFLPTATN